MTKSEQINELATALAKARKDFKDITRNKNVSYNLKTGGSKNYDYADLPEIHDATIEALSDNGLSVSQDVSENEKAAAVETLLMHSSGQWTLSRYPIIPKEEDMQSFGAAFSYARRMALNGALNLSAEVGKDGHVEAVKKFIGGKEIKNFAPPSGKQNPGAGRVTGAIAKNESASPPPLPWPTEADLR